MQKIPINWPGFNWKAGQEMSGDFIELLGRQVNEVVRRIIEAELIADVKQLLGRAAYEFDTLPCRACRCLCPGSGGLAAADICQNG